MSLAEDPNDNDSDSSSRCWSDPPPPPSLDEESDEYEEVLENKSCLPFESVARIMKSQIPKEARTKITQKSKELVQESVSEFIRFITCAANAKLLEEQAEAQREFAIKQSEERKQAAMNNREPKKLTLKERKKLNADDILHAMTTLGFDDYNETLREYLGEYRERNRESKLPAKRKRQKVQKQPER